MSSPRRFPAEYEPHAATWVGWPHNVETWPGCLEAAEREFAGLVRAIAEQELIHVLVRDSEHALRVRGLIGAAPSGRVSLHSLPTDDSWLRDTGPTFVVDSGGVLAIDWIFDAWGGKYPPWDRDAKVAERVAALAGVRHLPVPLVLEGGAIEGDGEGTLMVTRTSVLGRNRALSQTEIEVQFEELLGARRVIWLDGEVEGDDTDGHIDNLARFVAPGRVTCASPVLREQLQGQYDARGHPLEVVMLPEPPPLEADGLPLPASYLNFYLPNGAVIVPCFEVPTDALALDQLAKLFPGRRTVGVSARTLVRGFGGPHCLTQQQPAADTRA
jgi:agmatine deiminase